MEMKTRYVNFRIPGYGISNWSDWFNGFICATGVALVVIGIHGLI